ncbi:hypothetical protein H4R26_004595 [Coemansia thaxteri]|uniref:Uncharacterized protein n=1 Tax=Coemansia thaxteri TaxID=2663907 RepID=A0A9W8EGL5_9FUNG|nr:hypothetical protein H4R26_004595 [Coemansia thaxteri]
MDKANCLYGREYGTNKVGGGLGRQPGFLSLNNKMLEIMSWGLMETMTAENDYNQHIRRFLNILLGDDPDTAHLDLIDSYNVQEAALLEQLLQLVQESLSRSDEFLYRVSESRDRVAFAIEQKSQLKHYLAKVADASLKLS